MNSEDNYWLKVSFSQDPPSNIALLGGFGPKLVLRPRSNIAQLGGFGPKLVLRVLILHYWGDLDQNWCSAL